MGSVQRAVVFMVLAALCVASKAEVYKAGDDDNGMTTGNVPDYKEWSPSEAFEIGDFLEYDPEVQYMSPSPSELPQYFDGEELVNWTMSVTNLTCFKKLGSEQTVCRIRTTVEFHNVTSTEAVSGGPSKSNGGDNGCGPAVFLLLFSMWFGFILLF